jgi:hypothetical protein
MGRSPAAHLRASGHRIVEEIPQPKIAPVTAFIAADR